MGDTRYTVADAMEQHGEALDKAMLEALGAATQRLEDLANNTQLDPAIRLALLGFVGDLMQRLGIRANKLDDVPVNGPEMASCLSKMLGMPAATLDKLAQFLDTLLTNPALLNRAGTLTGNRPRAAAALGDSDPETGDRTIDPDGSPARSRGRGEERRGRDRTDREPADRDTRPRGEDTGSRRTTPPPRTDDTTEITTATPDSGTGDATGGSTPRPTPVPPPSDTGVRGGRTYGVGGARDRAPRGASA